jgi:hypothetical protein
MAVAHSLGFTVTRFSGLGCIKDRRSAQGNEFFILEAQATLLGNDNETQKPAIQLASGCMKKQVDRQKRLST